jgi:hypothetical protein
LTLTSLTLPGFFQRRRQLPAGTAPGGPEIDNNRDRFAGLDHLFDECFVRGVGNDRCGAFRLAYQLFHDFLQNVLYRYPCGAKPLAR